MVNGPRHAQDPLRLLPHAANAPFNSYARQQEPTCLQNTRVDLLREIDSWADGSNERRIFWLSGLAGTGKSTIARTVARSYYDKQRLAASFFFSRGGGDVGHAGKFVTSIAMQLALNVPASRQHIYDAIAKRRDIAEQSLHDQWRQIVLGPLSRLDRSSLSLSSVLVVDALDECEDEDNVRLIVQLLAETRSLGSFRLRVFLTSRPEVPIRHGFCQIADVEHQDFVLHNISPLTVNRDISIYLTHRFEFIARYYDLSIDWPGSDAIAQLVRSASGLFIWAATACRFVQEGYTGSIVRGRLHAITQCNGTVTKPEEHLDEIYSKVLTASIPPTLMPEEKEYFSVRLKYTLGSIAALLSPLSLSSLSTLLSYEGIVSNDEVKDVLNKVRAILNIPDDRCGPLRLHHPSFRDFLMNKDRCNDARFQVDEKQAHETLAINCIRHLSASLTQDICIVNAHGALVANLSKAHLEQCLPPDLQYACLYWIQHLQNGSLQLCDNDYVHQFLLEHFLHWLEALGWMGKLAEGINAIRILESITLVSLALD